MAAKKNVKKSTAKKSAPAKKNANAPKKNAAKRESAAPRIFVQIAPWLLGLLAVFIAVCYVKPDLTGAFGKFINGALLGLFSGAAYVIPALLIVRAIFYKRDSEKRYILFRAIFGLLSLVNLAVIMHGVGGRTDVFKLAALYADGQTRTGGGVVGGLVGSALHSVIGSAGLFIVSITLFVVMTIFFIGLTPAAIAQYVRYYLHEAKEKREQNRAEREEKSEYDYEKVYSDKPDVYIPEEYRTDRDRRGSIDLDAEEPPFDTDDITETRFEDVLAENNTYEQNNIDLEEPESINTEPGQKRFPDSEGVVDLADIFGDGTEQTPEIIQSEDGGPEFIEVGRTPLNEGEKPVEDAEPEKPKKTPKKYIFPPITLLNGDDSSTAYDKAETEQKAVKLIETLASFRVNAKIVDISHGPSITRYELVPEEGVRVRSIANLVDDIGLALAAPGVRIEAPIPGKAAVGIEVPNKERASVHLRTLIENKQFKQNPSRLNVALGMDVAGTPIYLDIAKMPHLLIAGTTGSGKSVCISSMIISMLYKATPEEVKMIIIDPKQIDFAFYNGVPHLLVPVVTDPKKAAGSLQWAVNEMERRYGLLESAGVRDIYNYNAVTKEDPTFEFLPQIVIIIDEFADLMQTAPDAVEDSVCRLAQKARAAGMHLIIGTQRPSVDVITGLIKSNFPSRIALTVKSQVDSRTMIDMAGAEKLIGKGDMLFAPVGAFKPLRVQGAFLDEAEIKAVTEFIKAKAGESEYDDEVMDEIEREAAKCGTKKSSGAISMDGDDEEEADPMLKSAIELAVDAGKISTSLIQRKLSLGYGRAAKLIDKMEQMAIVGPPDGNKPRQVLLTRQEYMEMVLNDPNM